MCSPRDDRAHRLVGDPPGVLRARCGALLSPVTVHFSDRPHGSPVCAACTERTAGSGPSAGWPLVELPTFIPGGQPVPSPARWSAAEALAVPPPQFPHPRGSSAVGIPVPVFGDRPGPCREPEAAALGWGSCPAERQLHLLDPAAVAEAVVVGWAKARCGRLIFAANLTLRGGSVGMCVSCLTAGSTPGARRLNNSIPPPTPRGLRDVPQLPARSPFAWSAPVERRSRPLVRDEVNHD